MLVSYENCNSMFWCVSLFSLINKYLCGLKAASQSVMPKLSSFIVSKPKDSSSATQYDGVVKTGAYLRDMDPRFCDLIRRTPVRKPEAAKRHPPKSINQTRIHQNKALPLTSTYLNSTKALYGEKID
ncbi:hypothetical protein V2J09_007376 [Rumex salicifolius]